MMANMENIMLNLENIVMNGVITILKLKDVHCLKTYLNATKHSVTLNEGFVKIVFLFQGICC